MSGRPNQNLSNGKAIKNTIVFERLEEVTPLMLQKLLYFIQGESYALHGKPMFDENCQAWVHGPVYPEVYNMFRDFKYNPIEDARFAIFEGKGDELTDEERRVIDLVVHTFGEYGGKVLERITHKEIPWKLARRGYADDILSHELIPMESIEAYYILKKMQNMIFLRRKDSKNISVIFSNKYA